MRFPLFYVGTRPFSGDTEGISLPGHPSRSLPSATKIRLPRRPIHSGFAGCPASRGRQNILLQPPSGWIGNRTHSPFGHVLFWPTSTISVFNLAWHRFLVSTDGAQQAAEAIPSQNIRQFSIEKRQSTDDSSPRPSTQ